MILLQIELLYFVLMIGTFIALLVFAKLPSGICLMASAVVGAIASALISHTEFALRYFVEGTFAYFDTILVITVAMIFMGAMQSSGALEYISAALVKKLRKYPTLLLICFMLIIMFPAMVTGSSLASAIA
ncbi:MAG: TRAP transporter large permease, partial [Clostridia bacterium]|nr:TRAP transporter large permease [Clostridia bacterium]